MQTITQNAALFAHNPIIHPVRALWRRWQAYRLRVQTVATLGALSDSQLRDVGLDRLGRDWTPRDSGAWSRRNTI